MRRRSSRWWVVLAVGFLTFSATFSAMAPVGAWPNEIHGRRAWLENDPGSFYVASAHELAWGESPLFLGHPGATLTPLLWGVQSAFYRVSGETEKSFTRFTAQNLPTVFFLSKLTMTFLHLLSFAALFALARRLLDDDAAATIATLAYATSLPVLYFVSRISVEPLLVTFFALSFVAVWRYQDAALSGRSGSAYALSALAGFAAVSGAVTKLNFLGLLPFFLGFYVIRGRASRIELRTRTIALLAFVSASGLALACYSQVIDWGVFASFWGGMAKKRLVFQWELADFVPGLEARRILLAAELPFFIVASVSWGLYLRTAEDPDRAMWFSAYIIYLLLLFAYRIVAEGNFLPFHYFLPAQAALSVFFGWGTLQIARKIGVPMAGTAATIGLIAWLGLHHAVGVWTAIESRLHDAAVYADHRPAFALLRRLGPRERVGVATPAGVPQGRGSLSQLSPGVVALHGIFYPLPWDPRLSILGREVSGLFAPVAYEEIASSPERTFVPLFKAEAAIVPAAKSAPP